jgi:hypothetical protein
MRVNFQSDITDVRANMKKFIFAENKCSRIEDRLEDIEYIWEVHGKGGGYVKEYLTLQ